MGMLSNSTTSVVKGTRRAKFDPDSLYRRNGKFYVDNRDSILKLDYQPPIFDQNSSDEVFIVLPEESWRPDLFAARVYDGRHFLARVIMRFNKLFHVSEFQTGMAIRCPLLARIEGTLI